MRPSISRDGDGHVRAHRRAVAIARRSPISETSARWGLAGLLAVAAMVSVTAVSVARAAPAQAEARPVTVYHNGCYAPQCPVRFTFSAPMVKVPKKGKLEGTGPVEISFKPAIAGTYHWPDDRNLVFTPAKGAMNHGTEAEIHITRAIPLSGPTQQLAKAWKGWVMAPNYAAAGKVAWWPVKDGRPRFVAFLNDHSRQIGKGPLFLLYDQPVDPRALKGMMSARDEAGRPLPISVTRPRSIKSVWSEAGVDLKHVVALTLRRRPKAESKVHLSLPTWDKDGPTFSTPTLEATSDFEAEAFSLEGEDNPDRVPLGARLELRFDRPVRTEVVRKHLKITPEPRSVEMWSWDHTVVAYLNMAPGTRYTVKLKKGMPDLLGNHLKTSETISFRTADLPPRLVVSQQELLLEPGLAEVHVGARNLEGLVVTAHTVESPEAFIAGLKQGSAEQCGDYPGVDAVGHPLKLPRTLHRGAPLNDEGQAKLPLGGLSGLYCLNFTAGTRGTEAKAQTPKGDATLTRTSLVQIADLAATVKVGEDESLTWLTGLRDGAPITGAQVQLIDAEGNLRAGGFTDAHGVARLPTPGALEQGRLMMPMYLMARHDGDSVLTLLDNEHLSQPWQFGLPGPVSGHEPFEAAAFTERGVYRPGETVHAQVVAPKHKVSAGESAPEVDLTVVDARGRTVAEESIELDGFGVGALEIPLKATASTGTYTLKVEHAGELLTRRFLVEEYRVPTFEVGVSEAGKKTPWRPGATVNARIKASYLHGGKLAGRSVKYTVDRVPVAVTSKAFPKFTFGGDPGARSVSLNPRVTEGEGMLDDAGALKVAFPISRNKSPSPHRYVLWAEVTDVDRQAYAGRLGKVVHPTDLYLGTQRPAGYTIKAGRTLEVPVVAVDAKGRPHAGIRAKVSLEQVEYRSVRRLTRTGEVRWVNHTKVRTVKTCRLRTAETARRCDLKVAKAGRYRVRVTGKDRKGRRISTGYEITASGYEPSTWPRFDQDQITVVSDKASYQPGDTAKLVVESPFEAAWALATLEGDGVRWHKAFPIKGDTPSIEIPLEGIDAPEVYAGVTLIRGRVHRLTDGAGLETGGPTFKIGYARLKVDPAHQRLAVQVTPNATTTAPGSEAVVDLEINGPDGTPSNGQAVVMAVDEAVLGLTAYRTPNPVAELFARQPLNVRTGEGRLELPQARMRRYAISPAGDGGDAGNEMKVDPTQDNLRNLFKTTAFLDPRVKVINGRARVRFDLPDNLTTYRVMAVVVDGEGRTGSAESKITLRKPLMVQAVVPRFVYPDDRLAVEALVYNATESDGEVAVSARFIGMTPVRGAVPASIERSGRPDRLGVVKSENTGSFSFPVKVQVPAPVDGLLTHPEVKIEFTARMGDLVDRVQVAVPVLDPGSARAEVANAMIQGKGAESIALTLPGQRRPGTGQIELNVSTTSLTRLAGAVEYLMGYPNGCIEQTTSRAYPLVMLEDLLPEMGVKVDPVKLKEYATAGVKRLLSFQTPEGGLSYWPGSDTPHAFGTAFGLTALLEAKKRGYDVPDVALSRMADYLERQLRKGTISQEMPHGSMADADTRALFVMTLGRLGRTQVEYIQRLWQQKEALTPFGLSFLATSVVEAQAKGEDKGTGGLLDEILVAIQEKAQQDPDEAWYGGKAKKGWSFDSSLRTHASALLAFSSVPASVMQRPEMQGMSGKLLNGLLNRQKYGLWGNTQENVFGVMGVARYVGAGSKQAGDGDAPTFNLKIDGQLIPADALQIEKLGGRTHRVVMSEARLLEILDEAGKPVGGQSGDLAPAFTIENPGGKPLTLTGRADYRVELKPEDSKPVAKGLAVRRSYTTLDGQTIAAGDVIPLGSVVRVRVEVDADDLTHYVAIDDKLPAGLEPMNAAFATSAPTQVFGSGGPDARITSGLRVLSHHEIRDERVAFYVDEMPKGKFAFTYLARATMAGAFRRPAARAEAMYDPETIGLTAIDTVIVAPNEEG
ncbi:MAG: alpha-2-macroglobulin family protein [Bradymonadia bacterium]